MPLEDDFSQATFDTFFMDKRMRRAVLPAMINAYAGRAGANIGAAAHVTSSLVGERGQVKSTDIAQKGMTHRENLKNAADEMLEQIRQGGMDKRTSMLIKSKKDLEQAGYESDISKMQEQYRLNSKFTQDFGDILGKGNDSVGRSDLNSILSDYFSAPEVPVVTPKKKDEDEDVSTGEYIGL